MKYITEMLVLMMFIIPTVANADDFTHKVSGGLTISNYNPDETYKVQWRIRHPMNQSTFLTQKSYTVPADGDGRYPFEFQCDANNESWCEDNGTWIVRTRQNSVTGWISTSAPIDLDFND